MVGVFSLALSAQTKKTDPPKKGKRINIENADVGYYKKSQGRNRLVGNVVFEHEGALMYCDSAWYFSQDNRLEAFENVRINQGDTLFLWGDYLEYNGNTKKALVTGEEVRLKDSKMELVTDRLDYDRNINLAYYFTGGVITSDENVLTSREGYYDSGSKLFRFKDSVVLVNPRYTIESDTLHYNSDSRISYFIGPSTITSDSSFIYCENGRYNTITDIAQFEKNAYLYDENRYLTGDSLYYEKNDDFGEAFENVLVHDTIENYVMTGGYGQYVGKTDSVFMTQEPIYTTVQDEDSLHIHGDTIFSTKIIDSLGDFRLVKVFHKVKFYKSDLQGKCDSLTYGDRDSIIRMYIDPLVWNDSSQVSGDTIYLTMRNGNLDSLKVYHNSFIINQIDATKDNQIKGKRMFGKFNKENKLRRVFVNGNGQTIYYPREENKDFIGMNRAICSNIIIKLKDSEVNAITFLTKPEAKLYPLNQATGETKVLEGFKPRFDEQPKSKKDLLK